MSRFRSKFAKRIQYVILTALAFSVFAGPSQPEVAPDTLDKMIGPLLVPITRKAGSPSEQVWDLNIRTEEVIPFDHAEWRLSGGARSIDDVLANVTAFSVRAEYLLGDATAGLASITWLPGNALQSTFPSVGNPATPAKAHDLGWADYVNDRFGTRITYPAGLFHPLRAPDNNDGRTFESTDGASRFYVFGQSNAENLGLSELMHRDMEWSSYDRLTYEQKGDDWFVLSGYAGGNIFYRKVILDRRNDIMHVMEITYPVSRKQEFDAIVSRMATSFGIAAEGNSLEAAGGQVSISLLHTPARGTREREALMDAARVPVSRELGRSVIFVVSVLNSDGNWAFLQAEPREPNGQPLRWSKTPFAAEMRADAMSEIVMVLMRKTGGQWQAIDYVIGPTDVHWINWLDRYGLPRALFQR